MVLKSFADERKESLFVKEYRRGGARFAEMASFSGAGMALAFALLMVWDDARDLNHEKRQIIRVGLAAFLSIVGWFIRFRPQVVEKNYEIFVGVPVAVACYTVASLGFIPTEIDLPRSGRLTVAMTVCCFIVYGFTRLPVVVAGSVCVSSATIAIYGSIHNGDDYVSALIIYLLVTNISGIILAIQIERRERELFSRTLDLADAREKIAVCAKANADASAAKSYVLAAVNHDLRQPVMSASLYLDILKKTTPRLDEGRVQIVERIEECVGAIGNGLSRLSAAAFPEGRDKMVDVGLVSIKAVFNRLESIYGISAKGRGVKVRFLVPRKYSLEVISNGGKLCDVLANLISNSIKFSSRSRISWVLVSARRFGKEVRISVIDNGIGIDAEVQGRIFEEYFRAPTVGDEGRDGRGLGLSIVKMLLDELPGHRIKVRSERDRGARFDIWIPFDARADC